MPSHHASAPGISLADLIESVSRDTLSDLVGQSVTEVLGALDPNLLSIESLRRVSTRLLDPGAVLRDPVQRAKLIDLLPLDKSKELAQRLSLPIQSDLYERLKKRADEEDSQSILRSFFGVVDEPSAPGHRPPPISLVEPQYALFDYQNDAARRVTSALSSTPRKVVLHMPTGSGKTRTAMHVVAEHLNANRPTLVCWLAQSAELLDQAAEEFTKSWSKLGNRSVELYRLWGNQTPDLSHATDGLIVAGLAKLHALLTRDESAVLRLADTASLTVIDEAHQAIAPTYRVLLDLLHNKRPRNALLGLTATPGRTWADIAADQRLSDFFANQKVTLEIPGYSDPVAYLMAEGYLAQPLFRTLNVEPSTAIDGNLGSPAAEGDFSDEALEAIAQDRNRNLAIVAELESLAQRHKRIIVFGSSVQHARMVAAVLLARGHDAEVVTGETDISARERAIRRFRGAGPQTMFLCNFGVLTTGFDAPATSAALIARPTMSLVLYSQMVGRATRGPRAGGNAEAEIVTVIDPQLPGFGDIAEAFSNWEDVWDEHG